MGKIRKIIAKKFPFVKNTYENLKDQKKIRSAMRTAPRWTPEELSKRSVIVFLAQYIPSWKQYEEVFDELFRTEGVQPKIALIPDQAADGSWEYSDVQNNFYNEIQNKYGADVIEKVYTDGTFKRLEDDSVRTYFYTRPYNARVPEIYRSEVLKQAAPLSFISYGALLTRQVGNVVINTDFFKDLSYYFADCESEKKIAQQKFHKLIDRGFLHIDVIKYRTFYRIEKEVTSAKKENSSRFTVMWTPRWTSDKSLGGSNFLNYIDPFISFAKKHESDIDFIFRPHPLAWDNFISTGELSAERAAELKQKIHEAPNIELDESGDYTDSFRRADLLVSDISGLVPEFVYTGKPLIFCMNNMELNLLDEISSMCDQCCYKESRLEDIGERILNIQEGKDPLKKQREEYLNSIWNDQSLSITEAVNRALLPEAELNV